MKSKQLIHTLILVTGIASANTPIAIQSQTYEQSLLGYNNGSIVQPDRLLDESKGIIKILRPRERRFAALEMVSLLSNAAAELSDLYPGRDRLQVGDIAQEKGGKMSGHDSHMNGLDADVAYFRVDHQEIEPTQIDGFFLNGKKVSYVASGKTTADLDVERNFKFIELLYSSGVLGRIFMDGAIKKTMCEYAKTQGIFTQSTEILRKMRPWPAHDDHMHIRIDCPKNSKRCTPQAELPPGSGCDAIPALSTPLTGTIGTAC